MCYFVSQYFMTSQPKIFIFLLKMQIFKKQHIHFYEKAQLFPKYFPKRHCCF